jgi:hypothetical protein
MPPLGGPEPLLQHLGRYGCDHGGPALARSAEAFRGKLVGADGRLDLKNLRAAEVLDAWGAALADGSLPADSDGARALQALWIARGWYVEGETRGTSALQEEVLGAPEVPREGGDLWRGILAIELALARALESAPGQLPTHAIPGYSLYRSREGASLNWFKESARTDGSGWAIDKELVQLDPRKPRVRTSSAVTGKGKRFDYGWTLDLTAAGASVGAQLWQLPKDPLPSELAGVVDPKSVAELQSTVGAEGVPCLVLEENGIRRWISPRLGLVREEKPGTFEKELVYTNARRY